MINTNLPFVNYTYQTYRANYGDWIQSYATKLAIEKVVNSPKFIYHDRHLVRDITENCICVYNAWFSLRIKFLPSPSVIPCWLGMHLTRQMRNAVDNKIRLGQFSFGDADIGCRDLSTLDYVSQYTTKGYLSRCLSLTLPLRENEPTDGKVFLVDCPQWLDAYLPHDIKDNCVKMSQRFGEQGHSDEWYQNKAIETLALYRDSASLVITTALHCAQPCLAMGIPVIFIDNELDECDRFSSMKGLTRIYTQKDFANRAVDFNPQTAEFEDLKDLMIQNLDMSLQKRLEHPVEEDKLSSIRKAILDYSVM